LLDEGMGGPRMTQLLVDAKRDRGALLNCPADRRREHKQGSDCQGQRLRHEVSIHFCRRPLAAVHCCG
jgi:hypothetical protein